jgi:hypothetical protein
MADPQPVKCTLFEQFARFIGARRFQTLCLLASAVVGALGVRLEPRPERPDEECLRWYASIIGTRKHRRLRREAFDRLTPSGSAEVVLDLDREVLRCIDRFIKAGPGRFVVIGLIGGEPKQFSDEIWLAIERIDFWRRRFVLVDGSKIPVISIGAQQPREPQQPVDPSQDPEPETAMPVPVRPAAARRTRRGPVKGEADRETALRRALVPFLTEKRLEREAYRHAIRRLLDDGWLEEIPGTGGLEDRIDELARVWGEVESEERQR